MTAPLQPRQIFASRYRIDRLLAQGGMGAVFVAEQMATERRVALKVLWPHVLASETTVEKFQLEAKVAARVESENIVQVLDAGFDEETEFPFLVMELLQGQSLEDVVEKQGPLGPERTVEYVEQVARGLDKAHGYVDRDGARRPIIHRDLKPENLFLTHRESGDPVVKILDFGIAKVVTGTANVSQEIRGTPTYMAYEQAAGRPVSAETDVWALGLITFFLLTGKIYWAAASNDDATVHVLLAEILSLPIDTPTTRLQQLGGKPLWPEAFDAWFARCVAREPQKRFSSAGDAARALKDALLGGQTALAFSQTHVAERAVVPVIAEQPARSSIELSGGAVPGQTGGQLSLDVTKPEIPMPGTSPSWLLVATVVAAMGSLAAIAFLSSEPAASVTDEPGGPTEGPPAMAATPASSTEPATAKPVLAPTAPNEAIDAGAHTKRDRPPPRPEPASASKGQAPQPAPIVHRRPRPASIPPPTPAPAPPPAAGQKHDEDPFGRR